MDSGSWHLEKRATFRSDSLVRDIDNVPETGCLSIVVLGASGDLAKKKTFPALFNLFRQVWLDPYVAFYVISSWITCNGSCYICCWIKIEFNSNSLFVQNIAVIGLGTVCSDQFLVFSFGQNA